MTYSYHYEGLNYSFRGQRQVEQELSDTREQVVDLQNSNASLTNAKRKLDSDIHQIQASDVGLKSSESEL